MIEPAALLRVVGVPVQEVLNTLSGPVDAPRVLIADGGWRIAPLDKLVPAGMARQRTLPGMVVMLGHVPGALHDLPVPGPEPAANAPPQELAGSRLARVLSEALALARGARERGELRDIEPEGRRLLENLLGRDADMRRCASGLDLLLQQHLERAGVTLAGRGRIRPTDHLREPCGLGLGLRGTGHPADEHGPACQSTQDQPA